MMVCVNHDHCSVVMATSCESKPSSAYSEDYWHMVYQSYGLHLSNSDVAKNLCVGVSTVKRTVKFCNQTGSVSKKKYKSNLPRKLSETVKFYNYLTHLATPWHIPKGN